MSVNKKRVRKPRMYVELRAQVEFLEFFQASALAHRDTATWGKAVRRMSKLKYVECAWIDHMCIVEVGAQTGNTKVAARRIFRVIQQVRRIIKSYRAVPA